MRVLGERAPWEKPEGGLSTVRHFALDNVMLPSGLAWRLKPWSCVPRLKLQH